ncbi:hypothetical protein NMG60_11021667 [Bertholletia excelsa]
MAECGYWRISGRTLANPIQNPYKAQAAAAKPTILALGRRSNYEFSESDSHSLQQKTRRKWERTPRPLITLSTSSYWSGKRTCDYLLSLQQLNLQDLAPPFRHLLHIRDQHPPPLVSISLTVHKHASFGLSVDGRIVTSFTRQCSCCSSPYSVNIDTDFNTWVLPSSRHSSSSQLPEIGGDDPSLTADVHKSNNAAVAPIDGRWSRLLELKNNTRKSQ